MINQLGAKRWKLNKEAWLSHEESTKTPCTSCRESCVNERCVLFKMKQTSNDERKNDLYLRKNMSCGRDSLEEDIIRKIKKLVVDSYRNPYVKSLFGYVKVRWHVLMLSNDDTSTISITIAYLLDEKILKLEKFIQMIISLIKWCWRWIDVVFLKIRLSYTKLRLCIN